MSESSKHVCDNPRGKLNEEGNIVWTGECEEPAKRIVHMTNMVTHTPYVLFRCYQHAEALKRRMQDSGGYSRSGKYRFDSIEDIP